MSEPAVVVENVSKRFRLYRERNDSLKAMFMRGRRAEYTDFWALRDVSIEIPRGSTYGLMGVNGSGKSTLLKCIANILKPDQGRVLIGGKIAALLELGSGFHPELSGRDNVFLNGSILGMSKRTLEQKFDEIVDFAGVEKFIDQPIKNYSSGMYVRLAFSVAINVDPDVLLVDEVLAVGDIAFQDKCMAKFADFKRAGKTVVIVSHAMNSMRQMCDEVAWLEEGVLVETGRPEHIIDRYLDEGHEAVEAEGGGTRWGSGEALIASVALLDKNKTRTTVVHTADEIEIELNVETHEPIENPVFGLTIWTREGVEVWSQHTRDADYRVDVLRGPGRVRFTVPKLMLLPGAYDMSASIVDRSLTHVYDYHRYCYPFFVESGPRRESGGLLSMDGMWTYEPTENSALVR